MADKGFDPSRYLSKVGTSDYLEVKWRLVWLRETHPDATIETELTDHEQQMAVFRAKVSIPGGGSATGWGSEGYNDFRDYLEKAETKALGRALAALGFGTQFCPDYEFGSTQGAVVDSPIDFASTRGRRVDNSQSQNNSNSNGQRSTGEPLTELQLKKIWRTSGEKGIDNQQLHTFILAEYKVESVKELSKRDASALIDLLISAPQRISAGGGRASAVANGDPYP